MVTIIGFLTACEQYLGHQRYPFEHRGLTMGTSFSVKVSTVPEDLDVKQLGKAIDDLLQEINQSMSTYIENSELSRFNRFKSKQWVAVSEPLYAVLTNAISVSELSGGAFDISVGPLVNLWGFGPDITTYTEPEPERIAELLNQIDYHLIELSETEHKLRKLSPDIYLDLSALAKGFAVDQVAELLEAHKIQDYLVEIGGEIRLNGMNKQHQPWRIAVEKPTPDQRMVQRILSVTDQSVATSGDYRNFYEIDGKRFSHTIDPRTGRPIKHKLASVTVFRKSCMEADALATALMVLGPEEGMKLTEQAGIAALFIIKADQGFIEEQSSAFTKVFR